MIITEEGIARTRDNKELQKYKVKAANLTFKGKGAYPWEHLYSNVGGGKWVLPVCEGKQFSINDKKILINGESLTLRDRQEKSVEQIDNFYSKGEKSLLILSDTATGKSYAIMGAVQYFKTTTVIIAPKKGILSGLYEKIKPIVNCRMMTASEIKKTDDLPDVLLTTDSSFKSAYNKINNFYNVLFADEIHNLSKEKMKCINLWKGLFVIGYTATPQRANFGEDGYHVLFKNVWKSDAKSLDEIIVEYKFDYDYSRKELTIAQEGLSPGHPELYRRLYINNKKRTDILLGIIKDLYSINFKRIMIFVDRDEHVLAIKSKLSKYNIIEMTGKVKDISANIKQANDSDEYIILGNMSTVKEGIDINNLQIGILFVSTSWIGTIVQAIGRMKRSDGEKTKAFMIDFVDVIRFMGSKKKAMGYYSRRRIYKQKGYYITKYNIFLNRFKSKNDNSSI